MVNNRIGKCLFTASKYVTVLVEIPSTLKTEITSFKSMKSKKHGFNVSPSKVPISYRKC